MRHEAYTPKWINASSFCYTALPIIIFETAQPSLQRLVYSDPQIYKVVLKEMINAEYKRPPWSALHDSDVDKDDFVLAANVMKIDSMNKEDLFELVSNVYNSTLTAVEEEKDEYEDEDEDVDNFINSLKASTRRHVNFRNQVIVLTDKEDSTDKEGKTRFSSTRIGLGTHTTTAFSFGVRNNINSARSMYYSLVQIYANPMYPVFHMRSNQVRLRIPQNLLFFEPRYRMLIREVMKGRKMIRGHPLEAPRPRFIFANNSEVLEPGVSAFIVEVYQCRNLEGGRAHIVVMPVEKIKLVSVREREDVNNGLHDARFMRLS